MQLPKTLNGYPVIKSEVHANCATIMVERADDPMPFVVATWWPDLKSGWSWGHYCEDRPKADKAFFEVSSRNSKR